MFLSIPRATARQESQGTRDTTPVCAKVGTARPRCTRYWRRAPCLLTPKRTGTIDPGPKECASHTFGGDPLTGIRGRCGGQAGAALCRCGSRPHRSGRAQGPAQASKVCLRCAHLFDPSRREASPLTRRHAVLQRRHCQQAASNDARRLTAGLVMTMPHARRYRLGIVMIVLASGASTRSAQLGTTIEAGNDRNAFWRPRWAQGQGAFGEASVKRLMTWESREAVPNGDEFLGIVDGEAFMGHRMQCSRNATQASSMGRPAL